MKALQIIITTFLLISSSVINAADSGSATKINTAESLKNLLDMVKKDAFTENAFNERRERNFLAKKQQQARLLAEAERELAALEARGKQLQAEFVDYEKQLREKAEELDIKQGSLKELFGVVRQASADAASTIKNSIVSAQYPGRDIPLTELAERKELPTIKELRSLWVALLTEMTESSAIVRFNAKVIDTQGRSVDRVVTRVGTFNLLSDDNRYLEYAVETGRSAIKDMTRQPDSKFTSMIADYNSTMSGYDELALDPTRGALLAKLIQSKSLGEHYDSGGTVGIIITIVLIIGLLIVIERLVTLTILGSKIKQQVRNSTPGPNPLGRIMAVYLANRNNDVENLELKLDEAVLRELPRFERGITFVKVLAAVSPLLGLFGTVTGMIQTFQSITLFGTSDPKLMADGISTALMTTVLGLISAIPLIIAHSLIATKSKRLIQILEEESVGLIAQHAEKR